MLPIRNVQAERLTLIHFSTVGSFIPWGLICWSPLALLIELLGQFKILTLLYKIGYHITHTSLRCSAGAQIPGVLVLR